MPTEHEKEQKNKPQLVAHISGMIGLVECDRTTNCKDVNGLAQWPGYQAIVRVNPGQPIAPQRVDLTSHACVTCRQAPAAAVRAYDIYRIDTLVQHRIHRDPGQGGYRIAVRINELPLHSQYGVRPSFHVIFYKMGGSGL